MNIVPKTAAISVTRQDGSDITYYLFPEYEVHYGVLVPGVSQPWHHHEKISETLFITSGSCTLLFLEENKKKERLVVPGDTIQVENTPHTFINTSNEPCHMIAFRFVPQGIDQHEVIKNDKVLHPELE